MLTAMIVALAFVTFTYAVYPATLMLRARLFPRPPRATPPERWPAVTCIVASHDEGDRLVEKVRALLASDYPGALEVVVADDGSRDGSPSRARAVDPARVRVASNPTQCGKPTALVRAVEAATGEVLILCDVRQRFEPQAVRALVVPLADPSVGAVTGQLRLASARGGPGAYWRYETAIRRAEGRTGSVIGASGAIYALRRELFPLNIPADTLLDDVFVPMSLVRRGLRVAYAEDAVAHDVELDVSCEFVRKVRTLSGNFQLLAAQPWLASPWRNPLFWRFFWHKVARLLCPVALVAALLTSFEASGVLASGVFATQLYFYALAGLGHLRGSHAGRLAALCHTFVALNVAAVVGFGAFARRATRVTWVQTSSLGGGGATS